MIANKKFSQLSEEKKKVHFYTVRVCVCGCMYNIRQKNPK